MAQPEEIQGVVEIRVEGAVSGQEIRLRHLSGTDASTLVGILLPVEKSLGGLRTVTLLVADAEQAVAVKELLRWLDVPALRRDAVATATPASAEESLFDALRCYLAEDGRSNPDYRRCREPLARALELAPDESELSVYAHRLAAAMDR